MKNLFKTIQFVIAIAPVVMQLLEALEKFNKETVKNNEIIPTKSTERVL
jgi:hypothetical protein